MTREVDMRHVCAGQRIVACVLITAICVVGLPVLGSHSSANITGTILRTDDGAPLAGATVKVARHSDARIFESAKTGIKGNYSLSDLPAGTYDIAVQTSQGLYVVNAPVALEPGEKLSLILSVRPTPRSKSRAGADAPETSPSPPPPPPSQRPRNPRARARATPTELRSRGDSPPRREGSSAPLVRRHCRGWKAVTSVVANSSDNKQSATAPSLTS